MRRRSGRARQGQPLFLCKSPFECALGRFSSAAAAICFGVASAVAQTDALPQRGGEGDPRAAQPKNQTDNVDGVIPDRNVPGKKAVKPTGKLRRANANSLPPLKPYTGAQRMGLRGGTNPIDPALDLAPTIAALRTPAASRRPLVDDRPFDPIGISLGSFRFKPYFEEDFGYSSNPQSLPLVTKGSSLETSEAGLAFQSNWARNDLHGALRGGYTDYFADPSANAPYGSGSIVGRMDISRDLSADAETHFDIATQMPGSLALPTGAVLSTFRRPLVETFGGSAGGTQRVGDLALSLHGTFDRTTYANSTSIDGIVDNLTSDDSSDWGLRGRAAYQISPIISPFLEVDADRRLYDAGFDGSGFARDSSGISGLGGATFALTGQLTGEASAGYGFRSYNDPRLPNISAPLLNASLIWSATPLTTVTLKAVTNLSDTTTPSASGAISRSYQIGVSHALLRNLTVTANAGYGTDAYVGVNTHDQTTTLGLGAEYSLSRDIVLKATATRTQFTSSLPDASYIANVFMLGLRFQR
jgi:hypothetical protein